MPFSFSSNSSFSARRSGDVSGSGAGGGGGGATGAGIDGRENPMISSSNIGVSPAGQQKRANVVSWHHDALELFAVAFLPDQSRKPKFILFLSLTNSFQVTVVQLKACLKVIYV